MLQRLRMSHSSHMGYEDIVSDKPSYTTEYWLGNFQINMPILSAEIPGMNQAQRLAARDATNDLARIVAAARKAGA